MGGLFDSLGVSLAFAGVVILLAGLFLTPMRGVLMNNFRSRRSEEVPLPAAFVQPLPPVQVPDVGAGARFELQAGAPAVRRAEPQRLASVVPSGDAARPAARAEASRQGTAAAETAAATREQEALFARALVTAHRTAEDLVRKAKAEAQGILDQAQTTANDIVSASRRDASDVLQRAEQDAAMIVATANEKATARLAMLGTEVERLVIEAHQAFQSAQRSVQQNVATLTSRLELHAGEPNGGSHDSDRQPPSSGSGAGAATRDGSGMTWIVPPASDKRTTVGVGADGVTAAERRSNRIP